MNNCAHGFTPWGTYLACEENWNGYFVNATSTVPEGVPADVAARVLAGQKRYGFTATGAGYRWHEHDARFDAAVHYNEPHRFGWVVEIDPKDRKSTPVKRTALGRIKHEGACAVETWNGRVVVYMGDDERFEYIYKFVSTLALARSPGARREPAGPRHPVRRQAERRRHRPLAAAGARPRPADRRQRLQLAGRRADRHPARRPIWWARPRWIARSGSPPIPIPGGPSCTSR